MRNKFLLATFLFFTALFGSAVNASDSYKLDAGDQITVTVAGIDQYNGDYLIPPDGNIMILDAGLIDVRGMTIADVSSKIATLLSSQLNNPQVVVTLKAVRKQPVYVSGFVKNPGVIEYKDGWTLGNAIAAAGGILDAMAAPDTNVILFRNNNPILSTTASEVFSTNPSMNPLIQPGDSISLEAPIKVSVYVLGEVNKPGAYQIPLKEANVLQAVSMAGGVNEKADTSNVLVKKLNGESETIDISPTLSGKKDISEKTLETGDIVVLPETKNKFVIVGAVKEPGVYYMKNNEPVRLSDAIGMAKGMRDKKSGIEKTTIVRNDQKMMINYKDYLSTGDETKNPIIQGGDVIYLPDVDRYDLEGIYRIITSLSSVKYIFD